MAKTLRKIANYRLHWFVSFVSLSVVTLFALFPLNGKAFGMKVFAGKIVAQIPMATCTNYYTCEACSLCGCGSWDQLIIAPMYGIETRSTFYACKMPSFMPMGTGNMTVGSTVFGHAPSNYLNVNDMISTNIWSMMW